MADLVITIDPAFEDKWNAIKANHPDLAGTSGLNFTIPVRDGNMPGYYAKEIAGFISGNDIDHSITYDTLPPYYVRATVRPPPGTRGVLYDDEIKTLRSLIPDQRITTELYIQNDVPIQMYMTAVLPTEEERDELKKTIASALQQTGFRYRVDSY